MVYKDNMKEFPKLIISDKKGRIFDLPPLQATGMKAGKIFPLEPGDLIKLPRDSEIFMLPERSALGYDRSSGCFEEVIRNPFTSQPENSYAAAVFLAPGYSSTYSASYRERAGAVQLPLFSYSAAAFYRGEFYAAGICVDREKRQALQGMDMNLIKKNVGLFRKIFPGNRLVRHLETCALCYGCPAAKNFFLTRYEAPLPTSPNCNSRCIGCISLQEEGACSVTQPRITFVPSPREIAEIALFHIREVKEAVVSFGQGCEGEPLLAGEVIEKAVRIIRKSTSKGVININTNASRPETVRKLFEAGMDSMRVSMNSVREKYYNIYYNPGGYVFKDVLRSIKYARKNGGFVSVNYLSMPGFTDAKKEADALLKFIACTGINMIQWRNLNYDPLEYIRKMRVNISPKEMIGMDTLIRKIETEFPAVMKGYFNPSKQRVHRSRKRFQTSAHF
ncbi:MAG: radical SAM protein [Candidatus Omnitrophota bacterium]